MKFESFDEYRASQARKRNKSAPPTPINNKEIKNTTKVIEKNESIGSFIESKELQLFIIVLIVLDSYLAFTYLFIREIINDPIYKLNIFHAASHLLDVSSTFCTGLFLIEISFLFLLFRFKYLTHIGYVLDTFIIGLQLYAISTGYGTESKVLNILRYWRLARHFSSSIEKEKRLHLKAISEAEDIKSGSKKLEIEVARLNVELGKEKESRKAVEDMLHNYKEEVETLNEALKIAAQDIAEAAQDFDFAADNGDGDDEDVGDYDDIEEVMSAGADVGGGTTKSGGGAGGGAASSGASIVSSRSTDTSRLNRYDSNTPRIAPVFQIYEDGKFEQK